MIASLFLTTFLLPFLCIAAHAAAVAQICRPDGTPSALPEWVRAGQDVPRALWLTNRASRPARFIFRFETAADGRAISTDEDTDTLAVGASVLLPATFHVPDSLTTHSAGTMRLLAVIDGVASTAEVPFRVYCLEPAPASIPVFDPAGALSNLLVSMECVTALPGDAPYAGALVVGPDTLQREDTPLPNLVHHAIAGHRVLAFAQPADWMLRELAMRAMEPTACTATSAAPAHALLQGLAIATSTAPNFLILPASAAPTSSLPDAVAIRLPVDRLIAAPYPPGWRALIETTGPTRASPLLEYEATDGMALLCLLDLHRIDLGDPAMDRLLRRLLMYTATGKTTAPAPNQPAQKLGTDAAQGA